MRLRQALWYLLSPQSKYEYVWKMAVLMLIINALMAFFDVIFQIPWDRQLPVYLSNVLFLQLPFLSTCMTLVAKQRKLQAKLSQMASTDVLTGLHNRRAFFDLVCPMTSGHLILLDVDHFKQINDTYGHAAGDKILTDIAQHLQNEMTDDDIVARYGGEEFVLFLENSLKYNVQYHARRLVRGLSIIHNGKVVKVTLSAGLAKVDSDQDLETALRAADTALYAAKNAGRACYRDWKSLPIAAE